MEENEIIRKEAQPVNNMEPKKGNSLTIILAVIAFLALGALAYVLFFKDKGEETDKGKTPEPSGVVKKLINISSCSPVDTTFNNIKLQITANNNEVMGCENSVQINGKAIWDTEWTVESIEFFDNYVIVFYADTSSSHISIYDTRDLSREYETRVVGYQPHSYNSDDTGITIIADNVAEMYSEPDPGSNYAKIRIKYENGMFKSPEVIEKYD